MTNIEFPRYENIGVVTDPGIDDIIALSLLDKLVPGSPVNIIPTFGNAPVEVTGQNAREFISAVAPHWKFINGAGIPQNGKLECQYPDYFHGPDGVWGIHPDIKNLKLPSDGQIKDGYVFSIGPMTAVAGLVKTGQVNELTVMGGAFEIEGNETPYAETNIRFDPDAAAEVFKIVKPNTVRVVPLDVTRKVAWSLDTVKSIPESNAMSAWVKQMLMTWFEKGSHEREEVFNLHDPLAVYLAFFPEHAVWKKTGVSVVVDGEQRGRTIYDAGSPSVNIALKLYDGAKIADRIFRLLFE
jgi:inosine-uridine nucleoside N-ribohydrolase